MASSLEADFTTLKNKVLEKKPVLKEIIQKRGSKNLYEYALAYISVNLNPPIQKRQDEFLDTFSDEVARRLGTEVALSAVNQLKKYYFVSTVDHHGPICSPFFINGSLLTAAPYFNYPDPTLQNIIVLSCGNVSLGNSSFPRGLQVHSFVKGEMKLVNIPFFEAAIRQRPVFNFPPFTLEDMNRVKQKVTMLQSEGMLVSDVATRINELIDKIYTTKDVLESPRYSDQIMKTNFHLWKQFFVSSNMKAPNLIYMEVEPLALRLLQKYHLGEDTIINHILFDPAYDDLIAQYFDGIMGAFTLKDRTGTYLFWALPPGQKYRVQLWKQGNELVTPDGSYRVALTPETLNAAIERNELIPSSLLVYTVLAFYYGLKCLGGFNQVNYLTFMKNAYIKMNADRGNYRSIEVCARSQTKELSEYTIAFLEGPTGGLVPATGLDLILYGGPDTIQTLIEESKQISLEESLNPLMPEIYRVVHHESDREEKLMAITAEDITKMTHLDQKIRACVRIAA